MATPAKAVQSPPTEKKPKMNEVFDTTVEPKDANFGDADFVGGTQSGASPKDGDRVRNKSGLAK